jgi:RNA 2',3'-cyclic 3'-phosphodiesterase
MLPLAIRVVAALCEIVRSVQMSQSPDPVATFLAQQVRVFVGLKISPLIASQLVHFAVGLEGPSVRRVTPADLHLTLVPPWNEVSIVDATAKLANVAAGFAAFSLFFKLVTYGPQPKQPRLLWVECAATDELSALHAALLRAFGQTNHRPFLPHVTLARIRTSALAIAQKHPINQLLALAQQIDSIELFQSPPPGEAGYRVLASLRLARVPTC